MLEPTTSQLSSLRTSLEAARASAGLSGLALAVAWPLHGTKSAATNWLSEGCSIIGKAVLASAQD